MVLQSTVLQELREAGVAVTIAVPDAADPSVRVAAQRYGCDLVQTHRLNPKKSFQYQLLRRYFFEDVRRNPALWSKHLAALVEAKPATRLRLRAYRALNIVSVRLGIVRDALAELESFALRSRPARQVIESTKPDLLVSTYPVEPLECLYLAEARRAGIPTVGHLLSWDNITVKGRFAVLPDHFITWGPIMSGELEEFYGTPRSRIHETGVAHFDHHATVPSEAGRKKVVRGLGLDVDRPYLFFGMSSPFVSPYEIEIVEELADRVRNERYGHGLQLVVRPHPQNVQGNLADPSWLPRLRVLQDYRHVAVDFPSLEDSGLLWSMKPEDLPRLSNLISGCAICLNSGSTLAIDAIVQDRPVIGTAFDAKRKDVPWWKGGTRTFGYRYFKTLTDLGGISVVKSFDEMDREIERYLDNPEYRSDGRARSRAEECGPCDGRASERVAEALVDILEEYR